MRFQWTEKSFRFQLFIFFFVEKYCCSCTDMEWYLNLSQNYQSNYSRSADSIVDDRINGPTQTHAPSIGNWSRIASVSNLYQGHVCTCCDTGWLGFSPFVCMPVKLIHRWKAKVDVVDVPTVAFSIRNMMCERLRMQQQKLISDMRSRRQR